MRNGENTTTGLTALDRAGIEYARKNSYLPPEEAAELERYYKQLRDYYGIPAGQPVFPPKPRTKAPTPKASPDPTARNRVDHPWRASIGKEGQL